MRHIQKVKVSSDKIFVSYTEDRPSGTISLTLETPESPSPALIAALRALEPDVVMICELPLEFQKHLRVSGVSFTRKNEVMGAVISAVKKLKNTNSPFNIHTPHLPAAPYNHSQQHSSSLLPPSCVQRLERLISQVNKFIDGERAQMELVGSTESEPLSETDQ